MSKQDPTVLPPFESTPQQTPTTTGGITTMGESSEEIFRRVTGAVKPEHRRVGDGILDGYAVEVKASGAGTFSQVRAVKYSVVVAHDTSSDTWFVVPPHEVVRLVARKSRGQHTENPLESATLSIASLAPFRISGVDTLLSSVRAAIALGEAHPKVKAAMAKVHADAVALAAQGVREAKEALGEVDGDAVTLFDA